MSDKLDASAHFYELDELQALNLDELQNLWDSVPGEEQAYLARVFEREASKRQIVEDVDEWRMAKHFLNQYQQMAFVPAGEVWVKVPEVAREQYKQSGSATIEEDRPETAKASRKKGGMPKPLLLLAVPFACLMIFALTRMMSGGGNARQARVTAVPTPTVTLTPTPTITPTPIPPTATPFALSGFDEAITSGERERAYYPVQLQVFADRALPPRVFIVQQQKVGVAEWGFDNNPDVVSWLRGMVIKPVLGVPFSLANLDLFRSLNEGSVFVVTMNTGDVRQFIYQDTLQVTRAETGYFRQDGPGLVLTLIGETSPDGSPTDLRYLVRAAYPQDQELGQLVANAPQAVGMMTPQAVGDSQVSVQDAHLLPSNLPDLVYGLVDVQLAAGAQGLLMPPVSLEVGGQRLSPDISASSLGNCGALVDLPPNTAACASLGFLVASGTTSARLSLGDARFSLSFRPPERAFGLSDLQVSLGRIQVADNLLTVGLQVANPTPHELRLSAEDVGLVLGFVPNPDGPALRPFMETLSLPAGASRALEVSFPYSGEGFATLRLGQWAWGIELR